MVLQYLTTPQLPSFYNTITFMVLQYLTTPQLPSFYNTITFAEAIWFIAEGAWGRKGGMYPYKMLDIAISSLLILFPF
jgi:hypothetical protein